MPALIRVVQGGVETSSGKMVAELVGRSATLVQVGDDLARLVEEGESSDLVVVGIPPGEKAGYLAAIGRMASKGAKVIVVSGQKDADLILEAVRAGASDFVVDGEHDRLKGAVRDLALRGAGGKRSTVSVLFAPKGGVGATSVATNLAHALHVHGDERVCLVDLNLYYGDVLSFLDVQGSYSVSDIISNLRRLDQQLLDSSVARHGSGVYVIGQSEKIEQVETVAPADVKTLLDFLCQHYDRVLVDGVRGFDDITVATLDAADKVLMLVTQDVPSLRNSQRAVALFEDLGYGPDKVKTVVNRFNKKSSITVEIIHDTLGVPVDHTLANDYVSLSKAINNGRTLLEIAPRSKLVKGIEALVPTVRGETARAERGGWFARRRAQERPAHA